MLHLWVWNEGITSLGADDSLGFSTSCSARLNADSPFLESLLLWLGDHYVIEQPAAISSNSCNNTSSTHSSDPPPSAPSSTCMQPGLPGLLVTLSLISVIRRHDVLLHVHKHKFINNQNIRDGKPRDSLRLLDSQPEARPNVQSSDSNRKVGRLIDQEEWGLSVDPNLNSKQRVGLSVEQGKSQSSPFQICRCLPYLILRSLTPCVSFRQPLIASGLSVASMPRTGSTRR